VDLGHREVQLLFLGRGHTAGDVVVFLPKERVLCSGDFFNGYIGYMGDAYVDEWADSLDRLARLDFETVVPGHGTPFKGKEKIAPVQACLRDLWRQAADLRRAGVPADEAAPRVDLRAHAAHFPPLAEPGFNPVAVRRIYEVLDERQAGR
jgi:cyclase